MISRLSIMVKLCLLAVIPLLLYIWLSANNFSIKYKDFKKVSIIKSQIPSIEKASEFVHETQKERGTTMGFLNGGIPLEKLNKQRRINDTKIKALKTEIKFSSFSTQRKDELLKKLNLFTGIRKQVDAITIRGRDALKFYSGTIKIFLDLQLEVADLSKTADISTALKNLYMLEEAKENSGVLRAQLTTVFAKNKMISLKRFQNILKRYNAIVQISTSGSLRLTSENDKLLKNFTTSKEWKYIKKKIFLVTAKKDQGEFNIPASNFFSTASVAINKLNEVIKAQRKKSAEVTLKYADYLLGDLWRLAISTILSILGMTFISFIVIRQLNKTLSNSITQLGVSSDELDKMSTTMIENAEKLQVASDSSEESFHNITSGVAEIGMMVENNSKDSVKAKDMAQGSAIASKEGEKAITDIKNAMDSINTQNANIADEVSHSNSEFAKITKIINEISEKTTVINDIVFQTKLLSFNASVEAARAGEHGKGFSVVAEEVGTLAKMSGNAADEITELLSSSIQTVERIVGDNQKKMTELVDSAKISVETGRSNIDTFNDIFTEIQKNIESVDLLSDNIMIASKEQSSGIKEIANAMEEVTGLNQNSKSLVADAAELAKSLEDQSKSITDVNLDLSNVLNGKK